MLGFLGLATWVITGEKQQKRKIEEARLRDFFFFQNNQIPQTILLVSQGFETILISNKSSAENSILLYNRV